MSIWEIRCYHNGCPKRRFFDSLPIDHIFVYTRLGPTNTIYTATAYCILEEDHTLTPSSIERKFIERTPNFSPIRVFLEGENKPKYYRSLNALAFKYEIEFDELGIQNEEKEIVSSFYLALRKKCDFKDENIAEIKVLRKDEEKTEEAAFLKSLDVKRIEEATGQLKSINVYERICLKDITEKYNEEKTPINELKRISSLGFLTFSQKEQVQQVQDLLHFFDIFLPPAYSKLPPERKLKRIKLEDPIKLLEKQYGEIQKELKSAMIKDISENREEYIATSAEVETLYKLCWMWLKKLREEPNNIYTQVSFSNILRNFEKRLIEAELSLLK